MYSVEFPYAKKHQTSNSTHTFGFPPKIMSVPLPAILVEIVIACSLPAWATISASLAAYWQVN